MGPVIKITPDFLTPSGGKGGNGSKDRDYWDGHEKFLDERGEVWRDDGEFECWDKY